MTKKYTGVVVAGSQKAGMLGFPTVNIPLGDSDVSGIYAGTAVIDGNTYHAAIFADQKRKLLEAHILDFSENAYGNEITLTLLKKIRESKEFPDTVSLQNAIAADVEAVRYYFSRMPTP